MSWKRTFRNSNGSYDTFDWTIGDSVAIGFGQIIMTLVLGTILGFVIPVFILLIYPFSIREHRVVNGITSTLVIIYGLLDYHFGWITWAFWYKYEIYTDIMCFNVAILVINLFLLFNERNVEASLSRYTYPRIMYFAAVAFAIKVLFEVSSTFLPKLISLHVM